MIKWLYNEFKETLYCIKSDLENITNAFYYAYLKHDDYSKSEFRFYSYRLWADLIRPFRSIKIGFKNIFKWWMIIWQDRDFDYFYMEELIKFKLESMEKFFRSDDVHILEAKNIADEIREAIDILDNLINGKYEEDAYKEYYDKYPIDKDFLKNAFEPCEEEKERIEVGLPARAYILKSEKQTQEQNDLFKRSTNDAENKRQELRNKLFDILNTKSPGWWD